MRRAQRIGDIAQSAGTNPRRDLVEDGGFGSVGRRIIELENRQTVGMGVDVQRHFSTHGASVAQQVAALADVALTNDPKDPVDISHQ